LALNSRTIGRGSLPTHLREAEPPRLIYLDVDKDVSMIFIQPMRASVMPESLRAITPIVASDQEIYDLLELKDGRKLERHSKPRTVEGKSTGRVWSYRDVTELHGACRSVPRLGSPSPGRSKYSIAGELWRLWGGDPHQLNV
jgi:hypothetical protein